MSRHRSRSSPQSRRNRFDFLVEKQDGRCYWCHCGVVRITAIPHAMRVAGVPAVPRLPDGHTYRFVAWRPSPGARTVQALAATFDHLRPLGYGGANTIENLVVACRWCNLESGLTTTRTPILRALWEAVQEALRTPARSADTCSVPKAVP